MRKVFIFACFVLSTILQAQNNEHNSSLITHNADGCLAPSKSLYNWQAIEAEFIKHLKITPELSKNFFRYAAKWKYLKMEDYFRLVKEGAITAANAQQYWLDKLPYFEDLYKFKYLPAIESEKKQATLTNLRNGSNSVNQTMSSCNNLDFSAGNLSNWIGKWNNQSSSLDTTISGNQYGYGALTVNGLNSSGGVNSMGWVHELCTAGTDPLVPISRIPPGHTYSLRLGNDSAYINASQGGTGPSLPFNHQIISNTFSVTPASQTITYWYAVVLDQSTISPHPQSEQPYFKIRMYNAATGTEITCAKYDVDCTQASTIGGFDSLNDVTGNYKFFYKNWTQVLIPLTSYIGQNVTITFETSDCLLGGHFGYAYLAVDCAPLTLIAALPQPCIGGNTTLTAPPGLATYNWTGPSIVGSNAGQVATVNAGGSYTVSMTTFANSGQVGCALVLSDTIPSSTVSPIASFSATTVCLNVNTQFTDLSTLLPNQGTITAWHWNFGDGGTSISHNPTHLYTTAGSFPVSYTITSSVGCTATFSLMVTVNPLPTPSFSAAPVCNGTATNFTNTSTGGISYHWNFGDGTGTSINQNPTYTYVNAGVYAVSLTVTNTFSCNATSTNTVLVNTFPTISFSAPPACLGTASVFNNSSTPNTGVAYSWNFGDATSTADTSNIQSPTYIYPTAGTYTVSLTITPTDGCVATHTSVVTVKPIPTVTVTSPSPVVCWNEIVPAPTLSDTPNDPVITYTWVNNNSAIGLPLNGIGIPPSFTAGINNTSSNIVGVISITPTLNGCTGPPDSYTVTLVPTAIVTHPDLNYCPGDLVPAISLTATPASATPSITWSMTGPFIGLSTTSGGTTIPPFTAISAVSTAQSIVITLQDNIAGCAGPISTFSITVNANPVAKFSYSSACTGNPTHFTDESVANSGFIFQWHWNFGGGNTLNQTDPNYQFTTVGNHTVNLQVTTNVGCKNDTTEVVYVNPSAIVSFFADTISCTPLVTTFTTVVSMPIQTWNWSFGNGVTATYTTQTIATQTYVNSSHTENSYYTVSLSVTTDSGCVSKITKNNYITVYPKPLAGFAWQPTNADVFNPTINFYNQSIGASGSNAYNWSFGDIYETVDSLNYSALANPVHTYNAVPYSYQVTQVVANMYGCKDSITQTVIIRDAVTFYIPNAFSPNYDGTNDGFKGTGIGIDNTTYNLWIFDRWGLMIWHSSDLETNWDGRLNGVIVQQDVYVWKVSFNDVFRKAHDYHGTVTVIK